MHFILLPNASTNFTILKIIRTFLFAICIMNWSWDIAKFDMICTIAIIMMNYNVICIVYVHFHCLKIERKQKCCANSKTRNTKQIFKQTLVIAQYNWKNEQRRRRRKRNNDANSLPNHFRFRIHIKIQIRYKHKRISSQLTFVSNGTTIAFMHLYIFGCVILLA